MRYNHFPRQSNLQISRNANLDCPQCGELRYAHFLFDVLWRDPFSEEKLPAAVHRCCNCGGIITSSRPNFALLAFNRDKRAERDLQYYPSKKRA